MVALLGRGRATQEIEVEGLFMRTKLAMARNIVGTGVLHEYFMIFIVLCNETMTQ